MAEHAEPAPSQPVSASEKAGKGVAWLAFGGVLGALGASSCCILPLVFISFGMGGAWLGNVVALSPYQPYFIALALACLGGGFYFVYRKPKPGTACAPSRYVRHTRVALWTGTVLVTAAIAYPYVAPLLFEM